MKLPGVVIVLLLAPSVAGCGASDATWVASGADAGARVAVIPPAAAARASSSKAAVATLAKVRRFAIVAGNAAPTGSSTGWMSRGRLPLPDAGSRPSAVDLSGAIGSDRSDPFGGTVAVTPVLRPSLVDQIGRDTDRVLPTFAASATRGITHRAGVTLPSRSSGAFWLADVDSGVSIKVRLVGALDVPGEIVDGYVVYPTAHESGADMVHRPTAEGTEDYLHFPTQPGRVEIHYSVALGEKVAGLRFVSGVLELLDAAGAPRLRIAPPYVVDSIGARRDGRVSVEGCAYDSDPREPWGRSVTLPGARMLPIAEIRRIPLLEASAEKSPHLRASRSRSSRPQKLKAQGLPP